MSFFGHSLCFNFQALPITPLLHSEKVPKQTLPPTKLTSTSEHTYSETLQKQNQQTDGSDEYQQTHQVSQ